MPYPKPDARKRAYKPKSNSGCITCKYVGTSDTPLKVSLFSDISVRVRRIKCDELKPHCRRCTSTGRKCDGYASQVLNPRPSVDRIECVPGLFSRATSAGLLCGVGTRSENGSRTLTARQKDAEKNHATDHVISAMPSLDVRHDLSSAEELSSFHFYESYASLELPGFLGSTFWTREVPLAARRFPAIRYAVVALGAMHRRYIAGHNTGAATCTILPATDGSENYAAISYGNSMADKEMKFALMQSNRAIREIVSKRTPTSNQCDRITVMTVCVLFTCMACIQGRYEEARQHLRSGIRLLREFDDATERLGLDHATAQPKVEHPIRVKSLRVIAIGLDLQGRSLMKGGQDVANWEPAPKHQIDASRLNDSVGESELEDAQLYLESTLNEFMAWVQSLGGPLLTNSYTAHITERYYELKAQADLGKEILERVVSKIAGASVESYKQSFLALRLIQATVDLGLKAFRVKRLNIPLEGETQLFDDIDHFKGMMEIIEDLMEPELSPDIEPVSFPNVPSPSRRPVFSFSFGILTTLWWIAQQAPFASQRNKAIAMMFAYPRREGFWDGPVAGRVAWEATLLEQQSVRDELGSPEGSDQLFVPEHLRIRNIDIEFLGTTGARIEFKNMRAVQQGESGWSRTIEWAIRPHWTCMPAWFVDWSGKHTRM